MPQNLIVGQSGGCTAVINATLAGVVDEALRHAQVGGIYGMLNGVQGLLDGEALDLRRQAPDTLAGLRETPSAALGSCRFKPDAEQLERDEDLPGDLIPGRYFAWLRGAPPSFLEPVFAHNRQDVLSMVDLLGRLDRILHSPHGLTELDRFSRARFLEVCGRVDDALAEYRSLWQTFRGPLRGALGLRLARLLCRTGRWREARPVLEACWSAQAYPYPAALELAKLLEHRARDLPEALRLVADALRLHRMAGIADPRWAEDLERRRVRLERRLSGAARAVSRARELPLTG